MSDLHWTGAAVLLALAVLGTGNAPAPRDPCVSWAEFFRRDQIVAILKTRAAKS